MLKTLSSYKIFLTFIAILFLTFFLFRVALAISHDMEVDFLLLLYSTRMDSIVISAFVVLPIITYTLNFLFITRVLISLIIFISIYLEIANYLFFEEFNTRLNYIFVEYLEYPVEIFQMIWVSYKLHLLIIIPLLIYAVYKFFTYTKEQIKKSTLVHKLILLPIILIILFIGMRSSFDSSTPNQSFYSYSNSTIKNSITNNTVFSLLYAIYLKSKIKIPKFGTKESDLIIQLQNLKKINYMNENNLIHTQKSTHKLKKNVVMVLMESFGSSYVGSLGGTPTTPHFDELSKKGLFLSNMYSSSNRSNRGFEAIISSIFPNYSNTYLKLPKSQNNFWTVAKEMKKAGFKTVFLYGGDSKFDNMKGFAINNGFDEVIDRYDFDSSIKRYAWGVNDEELYKKAQQILEKNSKPIFLVLFTLSSHKPFDYPDKNIELYDKAPKKSYANSIKYADFALYKFYNQLQKRDFLKDGVLAIIADHNAHMLGDQKIPVKEFRIPALFLGEDIEIRQIDDVTHQIDVAPTLLDIVGLNVKIPTMGNNITKTTKSSALIIHRGAFTYLRDNKFILYENGKKARTFDMNYNKIKDDINLTKEGLLYIYGSHEIYNNQLHRSSFE